MYTATIKTTGESMARGTTEARSFKVHSDATPEQLEQLRREVEARCPVSDNIANPTPVHIALSRI